MALRGRSWRLLAGELVTMLIVNLVIVLVLEALDRWLGVSSARTPFGMTLFFSYLLTLIIVLYDRYRTVYKARRLYRGEEKAAQAGGDVGPAGPAERRRPDPGAASACVDQLLHYIVHFDEYLTQAVEALGLWAYGAIFRPSSRDRPGGRAVPARRVPAADQRHARRRRRAAHRRALAAARRRGLPRRRRQLPHRPLARQAPAEQAAQVPEAGARAGGARVLRGARRPRHRRLPLPPHRAHAGAVRRRRDEDGVPPLPGVRRPRRRPLGDDLPRRRLPLRQHPVGAGLPGRRPGDRRRRLGHPRLHHLGRAPPGAAARRTTGRRRPDDSRCERLRPRTATTVTASDGCETNASLTGARRRGNDDRELRPGSWSGPSSRSGSSASASGSSTSSCCWRSPASSSSSPPTTATRAPCSRGCSSCCCCRSSASSPTSSSGATSAATHRGRRKIMAQMDAVAAESLAPVQDANTEFTEDAVADLAATPGARVEAVGRTRGRRRAAAGRHRGHLHGRRAEVPRPARGDGDGREATSTSCTSSGSRTS